MGDKRFHLCTDKHVILHKNGTYRQCEVYHLEGRLFAKYCGGFVSLSKSGTSIPNLLVLCSVLGDDVATDDLGRYKLKN